MADSKYALPIDGVRGRLQSIKAEEKNIVRNLDLARQDVDRYQDDLNNLRSVIPEWVKLYRSLGGEVDEDGQPYTAVDPHAGEETGA